MDSRAAPDFSADDLAPRLATEWGFTPVEAALIVDDLSAMQPALKRAFWHWWQTGDPSAAPEVAGYTLERLMREQSLTPVVAFTTLSWLLEDPEQALIILRRGHDRIIE